MSTAAPLAPDLMSPSNFLSDSRLATSSRSPRLRHRLPRRLQRAFTLAEVMIATLVFTMGILGVYAMMIKSYQLVTMSRHRDNARAVLLSFTDQFLRLQTADAGVLRTLFSPSTPSSRGLKWTKPDGSVENGDSVTNIAQGYIKIQLGDSGDPSKLGSQVEAHVTREEYYLDANGATLAVGSAQPLTAAGYIMQATFTIQYMVAGIPQIQSITVARSAR